MLLIVGLDGATLDLVEPWATDGTLPNLAQLLREGAWGPLGSTVPPATLPGWTTFMTGVNPGRHGVFDFTRRDPGDYQVRFVNATFRKAQTVWRLLSDADRRVSVLGLPGTYPPEAINGCMISGFDTPVTTRSDDSFAPPSTAVTPSKQEHIRAVARRYLRRLPGERRPHSRFDIVSVVCPAGGGSPKFRLQKGAFTWDTGTSRRRWYRDYTDRHYWRGRR